MQIPPPTPNGVSTAYFGKQIMKWGVGKEDAVARKATVSAQELLNANVTCDILENWRAFYVAEAARVPRNLTAEARAELMAHCLEMLGCPSPPEAQE